LERMNRFKIGDLLRTSKKEEVLTLLMGNPDLFPEEPLSQFFSLPAFSSEILRFFSSPPSPTPHSEITGVVGSYSDSNPVIVTHIRSHTLSKLPTFRSVLAAISDEGIRISGVRTTFLTDDDISKNSHILPVNMHRLSSRVSYEEEMEGFEGAHRVVMLAIQGKDVIQRWGDILGSEDPDYARRVAPSSLRANHGMSNWKNVASSIPSSIHRGRKQLTFFFGPRERISSFFPQSVPLIMFSPPSELCLCFSLLHHLMISSTPFSILSSLNTLYLPILSVKMKWDSEINGSDENSRERGELMILCESSGCLNLDETTLSALLFESLDLD